MQSKITLTGVRSFLWYFNKYMRHGIQGLFIDQKSVKMVKNLVS